MKKTLLSLLLATICSGAFANLTQSHWRWRNNDGSETSAAWKAAQDSPITINDYNTFRLRMEVYNSLSNDKPFDHGLQYSTSVNGPWYSLSDKTPLNAFIFAGDNNFITNNQPTTHQLTGTQYTFIAGNVITNQSASNDSIVTNTSREYEWCIKPTQYIQPLTKYFFKAASGDAASPPPSLTTGNVFTAKPVYISNGSFENNLINWTTATDSGSAATFTAVTSEHHSGKKALKITVTNKSNDNSVKLIHTATPAPNSIYLLRF